MNIYGLIGYPLSHSFSKTFFTKKFKEEKRPDCVFELFPLEQIVSFPGLLQNNPELKGLAVTIPYKKSVLTYLDNISEEAKMIGAVNCIQIKEGKLHGHNTDALGFDGSFIPLLKPTHKKALVLGTGGAAQAVKFILQKYHIPFLSVSRMTEGKTDTIAYGSITEEIINSYPVIINTTPVGMSPADNFKPAIPYQFIGENNYLYDLVYNPEETLFLKEGKNRGAVVKNGLDMLVLQAEENWRIWNS